ncbi:MAG TPA: class I SAM-dependent methyltransferase [Burkholderiales bacterium]|nr:class I SAM-dependent methyltransferase [Burkholderiales bacterium]
MKEHDIVAPSEWVVRWAPRIPQGAVLDVACGSGRHARFFLQRRFAVTAVDRDPQDIAGARFIQADIENGPWPLEGETFEGIVVTNYLHRPLFPKLKASLKKGGVLIYETFMVGNERFGRPSNPAFLLRPGELVEAFAGLGVLGFEEGDVTSPKPATIQRLCAVQGETV